MAKTVKRGRGTFIQQSRAKAPEEKAMYHAVLGAGRSRVTRDFFDLSAQDADDIVERLQRAVESRLARGA